VVARIALHTGDPGAGSANELSGGGYARQAIAWDPSAGGIAAMSNVPTFDVPAVTITWATIWNTAGTVRYGKAQISPSATFGTPGVFYINAAELDFSA
jgi:hypothetical protein